MRDLTLTDMERLGAFDEAERTFQMTEEAFRAFYELTARPVRVYLNWMVVFCLENFPDFDTEV